MTVTDYGYGHDAAFAGLAAVIATIMGVVVLAGRDETPLDVPRLPGNPVLIDPSQTDPSPVQRQVIDPEVLQSLARGDEAKCERILRQFRRLNDSDIAALREATTNRDHPQTVHYAHCIKGASKMIGATDLALVCEGLERAGRDGSAAGIDAHLPTFHRQLERLHDYFDAGLC